MVDMKVGGLVLRSLTVHLRVLNWELLRKMDLHLAQLMEKRTRKAHHLHVVSGLMTL